MEDLIAAIDISVEYNPRVTKMNPVELKFFLDKNFHTKVDSKLILRYVVNRNKRSYTTNVLKLPQYTDSNSINVGSVKKDLLLWICKNS